MCRRILLCSLVILLFLSKDVYSESTNIAFSKGEWTRLLDGAWYVQGYSHDRKLAYIVSKYLNNKISLGGPICPICFNRLDVKVLNLEDLTLEDGRVLYREMDLREFGLGYDVEKKIRFALIEPGGGFYSFAYPPGFFSPDRKRFAFLYVPDPDPPVKSEILIVDDLSTQEDFKTVKFDHLYPGEDKRLEFYGYLFLLSNRSFDPEDNRWAALIESIVGWSSNEDILYISHRTTDLKNAWLQSTSNWYLHWSLWKINVKNSSEELVWDGKDFKEGIYEIRVIPGPKLLVEETENIYILDTKGKVRAVFPQNEWMLEPSSAYPTLGLLRGTAFPVSPKGDFLILQHKETGELWIASTDEDKKIHIPKREGFLDEAHMWLIRTKYGFPHFSFSPGGSRLAYFTGINERPALVVMEIKDPPSFRVYMPDSPDEILFPASFITWVREDMLLVPTRKKGVKPFLGQIIGSDEGSWLLTIKEEVGP